MWAAWELTYTVGGKWRKSLNVISNHLLSPQVWNGKELFCTYCKVKGKKMKGRRPFPLRDENIQGLVNDKHYLRSTVHKMSITAKIHSIHCVS